MRYQFDQCLKKGKIVRISVDNELVHKEINEAEQDLASAQRSFEDEDAKWAIVQGYYAQFHALRALLFGKGYREKSHTCLRYAIEALFVDEGVLSPEILENFLYAMHTREGADYGAVYSDVSAEEVLMAARETVELVLEML